MTEPEFRAGLEGVIAGQTAISSIEGGLSYGGYSITDLAEQSTFLEVAYLLMHGELPSLDFFADFQSLVSEAATLPDALPDFLAQLPIHVEGMDLLRTGISALGHFDPQPRETSPEVMLAQATRLLGEVPLLLGACYRVRRGLPALTPGPDRSYPGNLYYLLTGNEPTPVQETALDLSLILYAEHEFNASTFTARIVASTGSDYYSAITAAVGALKGPLHGGANERVLEVLQEIGSPKNAAAWVRDQLDRKQRVMGFGHRVYRNGDPRAKLLKPYCRELAEETGNTDLEEIAETVEQLMLKEKKLHPNLDWPSARLYYYLRLEVELYTPLFVCSRIAGWSAHILEQCRNNRLIRPRSEYNGPAPRPFIPLEERG